MKKTLSFILSLIMVFGVLTSMPLTVNATNGSENSEIYSAKAINLDTQYSGYISVEDNADFYEFSITSSSSVILVFNAPLYRVNINLYDENGKSLINEVVSSNGTGNVYYEKNISLVKGTYYLKVESYSTSRDDYFGSYKFCLSGIPSNESFEESINTFNNSFATSSFITLGTKYNGQLALNDILDYYNFKILSTTDVSIIINASLYRVSICLYDENGKPLIDEVISSNGTGNIYYEKNISLINGTYYLKVESYSTSRDDYFGNYDVAILAKPGTPKIKSASNSGKNVKVTWNSGNDADYYYVYRKVSGGSYSYIGKTKKTYLVDDSAKAGKTYTYKIRAKNEAGYSSYSSTKTIKHLDQPTLKTATNTTSGVKISWGKVSSVSGYKVYRKTSDGWKYLGKTTKTYFTDKTAKSGKKYTYTVKAYNGDYSSSYSSTGVSRYYIADPNLKTPNSTKKGVKLEWSKVTAAEGYMVYRKTGSGSYSRIATVKGSSKVTYTDKSAKKGKKYTYKVKAYYSKTYSAYSNTKTIKDKY